MKKRLLVTFEKWKIKLITWIKKKFKKKKSAMKLTEEHIEESQDDWKYHMSECQKNVDTAMKQINEYNQSLGESISAFLKLKTN